MTDRIGVLATIKSRIGQGKTEQYYVTFKSVHDDKKGFVTEANMPLKMNKSAKAFEGKEVLVNLNFDGDVSIVTDFYRLEESANHDMAATPSFS